MFRAFLRYFTACALSLGAFACGDQPNNAPIIDSIEAPRAVSALNGSYAVPVTVLFHDSDGEAVTHVHYQLAPGVEGTVELAAPNPNRESTVVTIMIPASAHGDGRARSLKLSVIDGRGAESLPQTSPLTLD